MKDIDSRIFASVKQSKMVTEVYLGCIEYPWHYATAIYTADCTEAMPLNVFENVICGLLCVNEAMSINDIADVLGLNILDDPTQLMFKDRGEEEILKETLTTLEEYGMISSDDDCYSRIELTEIGKEYYSKRKKFKTGLTKRFSIFYDLESNVHTAAKRIFDHITPDEVATDTTIPDDLADEVFIKGFAHEQIPHIYDEHEGHSFTNTRGRSYSRMQINVVFGVLYNVLDKTYRVVVDPKSKVNKDYLQATVDSNAELRQVIVTLFVNSSSANGDANESQEAFEEALITLQSDIDYNIYPGNPEKAKERVVAHNMQATLFEEGELYTILSEEIHNKEIREICINMPILSEADIREICSLASIPDIVIYLITTSHDTKTELPNNVYIALVDDIEESIILADTYIVPTWISFNLLGKRISTKCYERTVEDTSEKTFSCMRAIAKEYLPKYVDAYKKILGYDCKEPSKDRFSIIDNSRRHIQRFAEFAEELGYSGIIADLDDEKEKLLSSLIDEFVANLSTDAEILLQTSIVDIDTLEAIKVKSTDIEALQSRLDEGKDIISCYGVEARYLSILSQLQEKVSEYSDRLHKHQVHLQEEVLPKIYVLDTNVCISCPTIFNYISKTDTIVVSLKILDELDALKRTLDGQQKKKLKEAIKAVNDESRKKRLTYKRANTKNLPQEFQRKSGDYMILSVAYEYKLKGENVILLTNDINLQNIAMSLEVAVASLRDIIPQRATIKKEDRDVITSGGQQNGDASYMPQDLWKLFVKAFHKCEQQARPVLFVRFALALKECDKGFSCKSYGYAKLKELCQAFPKHIELFEERNELCISLKLDNQQNN